MIRRLYRWLFHRRPIEVKEPVTVITSVIGMPGLDRRVKAARETA